MKIRFAIVAAVIAATAAACSKSPTGVDQTALRPGPVAHDGEVTAPPPPDTTNRGGGTLGSGS